jgi:hypothetical protein
LPDGHHRPAAVERQPGPALHRAFAAMVEFVDCVQQPGARGLLESELDEAVTVGAKTARGYSPGYLAAQDWKRNSS